MPSTSGKMPALTTVKHIDSVRKAVQNAAHPPSSERQATSLTIGSLNSESEEQEELVPGKLGLAFHCDDDHTISQIRQRPDIYFFSTDLHEQYTPFAADFGPVSIYVLHKFWAYARSKESDPRLRGRPLVYYTNNDPKNQANAAVLLAGYMMLEYKMTAKAIAKAFARLPQYPFAAFCDATNSTHHFGITLEDVLAGLEKAVQVGWFSLEAFNAVLHEELKERRGDLTLIGDKFVALRGPCGAAASDDKTVRPPSVYMQTFRQLGVTDVIRLNDPDCYDKQEFASKGVKVHDLHFADGTCPPPALVKQFLDIVDGSPQRVAVHCKAGLGRTGTMIGLWMMKNKGFSAREAIAWLRLCRPGCVMGPQQDFLVSCEEAQWDGNALLPPPTPRSSSSAASRASTAKSEGLKTVRFATGTDGATRSTAASTSKKPKSVLRLSVRELGRQIEQTGVGLLPRKTD